MGDFIVAEKVGPSYFSPRSASSIGLELRAETDLVGIHHSERNHSDSSCVSLTFPTSRSIHYLSEESHRSLIDAWLYGVVPVKFTHDEIAASISAGKLPPALPKMVAIQVPSFSFLDCDLDDNPRGSVLSALNLTDSVYSLLKTANDRECPRCGVLALLWNDPHRVIASVQTAVKEAAVTLYLSGAGEAAEWAALHGFTPTSSANGQLFPALPKGQKLYLLDQCSHGGSSWLSIARFLPTMLRLKGGAFHLVTPIGLQSFSRFGTCSQCLETGTPLPSGPPTDTLMTSSSFDGRRLGNLPYAQFIRSPINETLALSIPESACQNALLGIASIKGPSISLGSAAQDIPASQLHLARRTVSLSTIPKGAALVVHAPYAWLSNWDALQFKKSLNLRAQDAPVLAIRSEELNGENFDPLTTLIPATADPAREEWYDRSLTLALPPRSAQLLLCEWLEIYPLLSRRFAATVAAKVAGITEKDFKRLNGTRANRFTCVECKGTGFQSVSKNASPSSYLSQILQQCLRCNGSRFCREILAIEIHKLHLGEYLNRSFEAVDQTLRTLPRLTSVIDNVRHLGLGQLPLGLTTIHLSPSERVLLGFIYLLKQLPPSDPRNPNPPKVLVTVDVAMATLSKVQGYLVAELIQKSARPEIHWKFTSDSRILEAVGKEPFKR